MLNHLWLYPSKLFHAIFGVYYESSDDVGELRRHPRFFEDSDQFRARYIGVCLCNVCGDTREGIVFRFEFGPDRIFYAECEDKNWAHDLVNRNPHCSLTTSEVPSACCVSRRATILAVTLKPKSMSIIKR